MKLATIRTIRRGRFTVEIAEHVEHAHPADTIAFGDTPEDLEAEQEYIRKIEQGDLPWYCLGVHVYYLGREIGSSYLGCVDTYDLHAVGLRDVVADAIREAREFLAEVGRVAA